MRCRSEILLAVVLQGCATRAITHAPAQPDRPWPIPGAASEPSDPAGPPSAPAKPAPAGPKPANAVTIEPGRSYELAALIDIAQRKHPATREAWEEARQAALAIGIAESKYLPELTLDVIAGLQHTPLPITKNVNPRGYFISNTREIVPMLTLKWLLFDFGLRASAVEVAKERSFMANVAFTGAHQKVVFEVSRDYFALGAARGRLHVAEQSVKNAEVAEDASSTRLAHGFATVVDVAQAKRRTAQAKFDLVRATSAEHAAYAALVASMGVEPSEVVVVADSSAVPLPVAPTGELDAFIDGAVARRPDVAVALAKVRAAEHTIEGARAKYYPKVGITGTVFQNWGALSTEGSDYYTVYSPGASVLLGLSWTLFDGGERDAHVAIARSELAASKASLDHTKDKVVKEVTNAYDAVRTSYAEHDSAVVLERAAETAYDAALDTYKHGVGNYTDLVNAETALSQARFEKENAHANVFTSAASLAFATGTMLSEKR